MKLSKQEINHRIALDFNKNIDDILLEIKEIYPNVSEKDIKKWENSRALEFIEIDGKKRYFRRAARNLFRIDKEAKKLYLEKFGDERAGRNEFLKKNLQKKEQSPLLTSPIRGGTLPSFAGRDFTFNFRLTLAANAVPNGKIIRCWLPFPRQDVVYQQNIKLISVNSDKYQISENSVHQTIYFEKIAKKDEETIFEVKYSFDTAPFISRKETAKSANLLNSSLRPLRNPLRSLREIKPHIVFSKKIKKISTQILGDEQDSYKKEHYCHCGLDPQSLEQRAVAVCAAMTNYEKAKKIFTWISQNIPWAAAREYSTIKNIPQYVLKNRHGDCGQVTLLFITLCRLNGIPARWLSGFMLHPNYENLHDWAEIFIDGKGWLPVDVSFGLQNWAETDDLKYFYFGNMDAFRLIINNDISGELCPAKIFPRSETVDFQRGEVEWSGGNIYFDKFNYDFWVEKNNANHGLN